MSPVTTINQWETPHTPCVTSLDPIPFWPGLGSRLLHEKTLFCSLIPRLSWNANILSPAQLQCSRSRAWEPGNKATFSDILGYKSSWQIEQKLTKVISTSTTKLPKKMIPCIAENYKGKKKNFCKFWGFVAIRDTLLCKIWGHGNFCHHQRAIRKSFFCNLFATNFWKFSPSKVSYYIW